MNLRGLAFFCVCSEWSCVHAVIWNLFHDCWWRERRFKVFAISPFHQNRGLLVAWYYCTLIRGQQYILKPWTCQVPNYFFANLFEYNWLLMLAMSCDAWWVEDAFKYTGQLTWARKQCGSNSEFRIQNLNMLCSWLPICTHTWILSLPSLYFWKSCVISVCVVLYDVSTSMTWGCLSNPRLAPQQRSCIS